MILFVSSSSFEINSLLFSLSLDKSQTLEQHTLSAHRGSSSRTSFCSSRRLSHLGSSWGVAERALTLFRCNRSSLSMIEKMREISRLINTKYERETHVLELSVLEGLLTIFQDFLLRFFRFSSYSSVLNCKDREKEVDWMFIPFSKQIRWWLWWLRAK